MQRVKKPVGGVVETPRTRVHDPITPSIANGFFRMENDPGQSIANDTTKGIVVVQSRFPASR